ncbi:MAG: hypothetical protein GC181_05265 [Bacteroidetes bacterium]|nr:hypothetical protein [Bacteroidota bacterium]
MILFYSDQKTPRLEYILHLFGELSGAQTNLTDSVETFNNHLGAKISYSNNLEAPITLAPSSLLFEDKIEFRDILKGSPWYGLPTLLFETENFFDPLAMSFYLVSRYEEYGNFTPDAHNRFPAESSCLVKTGLIQKPLVNLWLNRLADLIKDRYPETDFKPRRFEFLSTIDIDQAWKFKNKGVLRWLKGLAKEIKDRDWVCAKERFQILFGKGEDPFFNFEWQNRIHEYFAVRVQYFFQVGDYGQFDKNIRYTNHSFRKLIREMNDKHSVGIHPSYQSNSYPEKIASELKRLQDIIGAKIKVSRQHYLIHTFPETYQRLLDIGITEDHTMGYSTHSGFRAGIAAPFHFFDLTKNVSTELILVPFCLMDITPMHYDQLVLQGAKNKIDDLIWEVQQVGGLMATLWHNESISEDGRWKGWREMYEYLLEKAAQANR